MIRASVYTMGQVSRTVVDQTYFLRSAFTSRLTFSRFEFIDAMIITFDINLRSIAMLIVSLLLLSCFSPLFLGLDHNYRTMMMRQMHESIFPLLLTFLLSFFLFSSTLTLFVSGVPFSSVAPLQGSLRSFRNPSGSGSGDGFVCTFNARGLGITSITSADLCDIFSKTRFTCGRSDKDYTMIIDLSHNELTDLPNGLLCGQPNLDILSFDFSHNRLNSSILPRLFCNPDTSDGAQGRPACIFPLPIRMNQLDLSFNPLNGIPTFPIVTQPSSMAIYQLFLMGCNITAVPPYAFKNSRELHLIDLSLNDLSSGLSQYSFNNITTTAIEINLAFCRLRSSSLSPYMFHSPLDNSQWSVNLGNTITHALPYFPDSYIGDKRYRSASTFNPGTRKYNFQAENVTAYADSWSNFYSRFPGTILRYASG